MANRVGIPTAKILEQRSYIVPGRFNITEYFFEVPRDYASPKSGTIRLFARGARPHKVPIESEDSEQAKKKNNLPWLCYLQGGPGHQCKSPQAYPFTRIFLDKGYQMLFLDQRGTGLSSSLSASTLGLRGDDSVQTEYLKHFRADNIVRDAEAIRQALVVDCPAEKQKWSTLGQSFGGFITTTYLSFYPQGLKECFITAGLPPMVNKPDEVYRRLWKKVAERNQAYYMKFPEDVERVKALIKFLQRHGGNTVRLPSEGILSPRRFLMLGMSLGMHGGIDSIHENVLRATNDLQTVGYLTRQTTNAIEQSVPFDDNILYAILHEAIYCQGEPSEWSAFNVMDEYPEFDLGQTLEDPNRPVYFIGETILPDVLGSFTELRKLRQPAENLAKFADWPMLYDEKQLMQNQVPVYATICIDDMYVDYEFARETARKIKGCKTVTTNTWYHNSSSAITEEVYKSLLALRDDTID